MLIIIGIVVTVFVAGLITLVVIRGRHVRWSRKWENDIWKNLIGWDRREEDDEGDVSIIFIKSINGESVSVHQWEFLTTEGYAKEWLVRVGKQQVDSEIMLREDEEACTNHGIAWKIYQAVDASNL